jgi:hypothetical protein
MRATRDRAEDASCPRTDRRSPVAGFVLRSDRLFHLRLDRGDLAGLGLPDPGSLKIVPGLAAEQVPRRWLRFTSALCGRRLQLSGDKRRRRGYRLETVSNLAFQERRRDICGCKGKALDFPSRGSNETCREKRGGVEELANAVDDTPLPSSWIAAAGARA